MRTRRSNQAKRYTLDQYDFLGSASEKEDGPVTRRQKKNNDEDGNFDQLAKNEAVEKDKDGNDDSDDDDDAAGDADMTASSSSEAPEKDGYVEGSAPAAAYKRRRPRQQRGKFLQSLEELGAGYLPAEPLPVDTHLPRGYVGTFERHVRGKALVKAWYGGQQTNGVETAARLINRLGEWTVLPPKPISRDEERRCIWKDASFFDEEQRRCREWLRRLKENGKMSVVVPIDYQSGVELYQLESHSMAVLLGPQQMEYRFSPGEAYLVSHTDLPFVRKEEKEEKTNKSDNRISAGWILDAGGIVTGLDWAVTKPDASEAQLLALAVLPFSDHDIYNYEEEAVKPGFQKYGVVQVWEFHGERTSKGLLRPSTSVPARLRKTLCFDKGRARKVAWSPVCHHLAVLCTDGNVYIIKPENGNGGHEYVQQPIACLSLTEEKDTGATSMAWNNFNRITTGHKDGSICFWSIYPTLLLSRHSIHHSPVISMAAGYPSHPYLVASSPIGGTLRLVDLRSPSHEISEVVAPAIVTSTESISWCDHLQGFYSLLPSSNVLHTMIGFAHIAHFPIVRRTFTGERIVTCFASGRTHPYLLVGGVDGTLWSLNSIFEIVRIRREPTDRVRVLQHEHRPEARISSESQAEPRGAVRLVRGWAPEKTKHSPTADMRNPPSKKKAKANSNNNNNNKKEKHKEGEIPTTAPADGEDPEAAMVPVDPLRGIVYEPRTRITAVEWNPNGPFGCWAAVAFGSGLVRVLDLGLERE